MNRESTSANAFELGLFPAAVAVFAEIGEPRGAALFPEEETALGRVSERRRRDFTIGRWCARRALQQLGLPQTPLLSGSRREPLWPEGVSGSISHCDGMCVAAVAASSRFRSIGIDAEVHRALPRGVIELIARAEERSWIGARAGDSVHWDCVLFSAKESVYKAWYPLAHRWLGFQDAIVILDAERRRFEARLRVSGPIVDGEPLMTLRGSFRIRNGHVITGVAVDARAGAHSLPAPPTASDFSAADGSRIND